MRASIAGALLLVVALLVAPARAQTDDALVALEAAQAHMAAGEAHLKEKRYADAIAAYEAAYAAFPYNHPLLRIAQTHALTDTRCTAGPAAWRRVLEDCPDCTVVDHADAERQLEALRQTCPVRVRITSEPPEARIEIDGRVKGVAPLALELTPGAHVLLAALADHPPLRTEFTVDPGQPLVLPIRMGETLIPIAEPALGAPVDNTWAVTAWATGAVGATLGAVFLVQMYESIDDFDGAETERAARNARGDAQRQSVLAQVGLGVALAGAAVGWLLWESGPDTQISVSPIGATMQVRF